MKLLLTIPSLTIPHGGTRVILEWATRLDKRGHQVTLFVDKGPKVCPWYHIPKSIPILNHDVAVSDCEVLVICSPHSIRLQDRLIKGQRCYIFIQMLEHLFKTSDVYWKLLCDRFYFSTHPMISISNWNIKELRAMGRQNEIYYVGNGVNLEHFPIVTDCHKNSILVEGWEPNNPSKDSDQIAAHVALRLKKEYGFPIVAYGQKPLTGSIRPDRYVQLPDLATMNELYSDAILLLKASHFDARSCVPMEAMTKGTPTVRAIEKGDDDLTHEVNCLRCDYSELSMYENAKRLLDDGNLYQTISANCVEYVTTYTWEYWMDKIEKILRG